MNSNNAGPALKKWLSEADLSMPEFYCLVYATRSTIERMIRDGREFIPTQHRVYLLTKLTEFKLTSNQLEKYQKNIDRKSNDYWDEKISEYFINEWRKTGKLPNVEYRLATTSSKYQNRELLTQKIKKELLGITTEPEQKVVSVVNDSRSPLSADDFSQLHQKIEAYFRGVSEEELLKFVTKNKKAIALLFGDLVVLTDSKPFDAVTNLREKVEFLNKKS